MRILFVLLLLLGLGGVANAQTTCTSTLNQTQVLSSFADNSTQGITARNLRDYVCSNIAGTISFTRLSLGLSAPPVPGYIDVTDNQEVNIRLTSYGSQTGPTFAVPYFQFQAGEGTAAAPSYPLSGDDLGHLDFWGYTGNNPSHDGSNFYPGGRFQCSASENWTSTHQGTLCYIRTTHAGASQTLLSNDFSFINGQLSAIANSSSTSAPPFIGASDLTSGINFPASGEVGIVLGQVQYVTVGLTSGFYTQLNVVAGANGTGQGFFGKDSSNNQLFSLTRNSSNYADLTGFSGVCLGQGTVPVSVCNVAIASGIQIGSPSGGDKGIGTANVASLYYANGTAGVTCAAGATSAATLAVTNGIVTHC